jgi:hypothetical protein
LKVELTDQEWMSIIDKSRAGLPMCCANISNLRDTIIQLAREGGEALVEGPFVLRAYRTCLDGHDMDALVTVTKIVNQLLAAHGWSWDMLREQAHGDNSEHSEQ